MLNLADIYTDYLIAQNKHATATGLADLIPDELSHDQITRLLNKTPQTSKDLWLKIKADVREYEGLDDGVLALDDMIAEKPYSDENDIIAWHYDHSKGRTVKGINILTAMVSYGDVRLPIAYEVIEKTIRYSDLQTKKERRKSSFTKNDLFLKLLNVAIRNDLKFAYVLADRWFSSQSNMSYIHNVGKKFIMGIKSNRCVALTEKDKENGKYQQLKQISLEDGIPQTVYLKGMAFKVQVMKKTFKNENGKESVLYLVTNDLSRKRRYLGRYFAHPMIQNRRAKRDDYKPSAVRVTQRCVP